MARQPKNAILDKNGIAVGSELTSRRTVEKYFKLSRASADWPTDAEGNPVALGFDLIIDLNGVKFEEILDDGIRAKVIEFRNTLHDSRERNQISFEELEANSKKTLHLHYNRCNTLPWQSKENLSSAIAAYYKLTPEQQTAFSEMILGRGI